MATSTDDHIGSAIKNDNNVILQPGDAEIARLTLSFQVLEYHLQDAFGSLVIAPADLTVPGLRILDQACANGLWLRRVRDAAPVNHTYVGTDIVESYFPESPPENVTFTKQSMTQPWPSSFHRAFDLVHSRFSLAGAGTYPLASVIKAEVELLKPGGWIQLEEMDVLRTQQLESNGPVARDVYTMLAEMFRLLGAGDDFASKLTRWMVDAGLEDVQRHELTIDYGCNASVGGENVEEVRKIGTEAMVRTVHGLVDGAPNLPLSSLTPAELQALPDRIRKECTEFGSSLALVIICGRKPASS